ncbi:MAG: hypothetical protein B6U87_02400, partial [Candidatus Aenigmarchaeota archaeon ex4484_52]
MSEPIIIENPVIIINEIQKKIFLLLQQFLQISLKHQQVQKIFKCIEDAKQRIRIEKRKGDEKI